MNIKLASVSVPHRLWFFTVVLICISLMINDVEHLFMYLSAICISSLGKCLFKPSAHILIRLFFFWLLSCMSSLHIQHIGLLSDMICNYFLPLLGCLVQSLLIFFFFYCFCFWHHIQNIIAWTCVMEVAAYIFFWEAYLSLTFRSLIHLVNFGVWYKIVSQFHSFACSCPMFPTSFFQEAILSPLYIFCSFVIN